jgi:hypothetical protein
MAPQSDQRTDPAHNGYRHRRYGVLGTLAAVLLLGGAFLGVTQGDWILFDGAALYLLIAVVMIATDTPPRRPPTAPPDPSPDSRGDANDTHDADNGVNAPTHGPLAASSHPAAHPLDGTLREPPAP